MGDQNFNPHAISRMRHLLSMRDCLLHSNNNGGGNNQNQDELNNLYQQRTQLNAQLRNFRQVNPFPVNTIADLDTCSGTFSRVEDQIKELEKQQITDNNLGGRIRALYLPHIATAPLLQVDDLQTANMARELHENYGWRGTVCVDTATTDEEVRNIIEAQVGPNIPLRTFVTVMGQPLFQNNNNNN